MKLYEHSCVQHRKNSLYLVWFITFLEIKYMILKGWICVRLRIIVSKMWFIVCWSGLSSWSASPLVLLSLFCHSVVICIFRIRLVHNALTFGWEYIYQLGKLPAVLHDVIFGILFSAWRTLLLDAIAHLCWKLLVVQIHFERVIVALHRLISLLIDLHSKMIPNCCFFSGYL